MPEYNFIFDFDSTITRVEALDELADIIAHRKGITDNSLKQEIERITTQAMNGEIGFDVALDQRIALLDIQENDIAQLIERLKNQVSQSFIRNRAFFQHNSSRIYVISGGFEEYIIPVVETLGIRQEHVFANNFIRSEKSNQLLHDKNNALAKEKGKVLTMKGLPLKGLTIAIGDGYTDYELKLYGMVDRFYLYAEHVNRSATITKADAVIFSLDDLLNLIHE